MKTRLIFPFFIFILVGCVSTNFIPYKPNKGVLQKNNYFEISNSNGTKNLVSVGILTLFNRENDYFISVNFKNKEDDVVQVESLHFGKIEKSSKDERVYLKKINVYNSQKDTIYLKFPDKIYKFYND